MFELFLLYHIVFVKFPYISSYATIQRLATIFLFIMILPYSIRCLKKMNLTIKLLLLLYIIIILISTIINRNELVMTNVLIGGIMYTITFFELFIVFSSAIEKKSIGFIIRIFLYLTFFYIIVTDFLIVINSNLFSGQYYFIGNKFSVAYKHLELVILFLMNQKINSLKEKSSAFFNINIVILIAIGLVISYLINTTTGIIAMVVLVVILLFFKDKLLYNSIFFILVLINSSVFIVYSNMILQWKSVQYFIVDVLHKDLTMTGRMMIYDNITKLIKGHFLFGYGYNTAYEVWTNYVSYMPNAQNGLINFIFEQGLIATIIIIILIKTIIGKSNKSRNVQKIYKPIMALLYVYAILSTIEITIDIVFIGWVVLFYTNTLVSNRLIKETNYNFKSKKYKSYY